jgi:branched-chain amino acid aminotransferase
MHRYVLHNGRIAENTEKLLAAGQVGLMNGWGVFSTLRVQDGVLFAWERHVVRMRRDAALLRVPFPEDTDALHADLLRLVEANHAQNATMRVCIVRNRGGMFEGDNITSDYDILAFSTVVRDWGRGVNLGVQENARFAACPFSGAKVLSWAMNLTWLEMARERGFDEAILLNEHHNVSECTSANIFAAVGNQVFTPPLSAGCLPGITRELLLNEAKPEGMEVTEKDLTIADLRGADAVFITSTTRELLAVLSIDNQPLTPKGNQRERLQTAFSTYVDRYIAESLAELARLMVRKS